MIIPETIPDQCYFSAESLAKVFSVPRRRVYDWIAYGKINAVHIVTQKTIRVPRESVLSFVANGCKGFANTNKRSVTKRLVCSLRHRIADALKVNTKSKRTIELLGCSPETFRPHIAQQFQPGMTFDNYGKDGWHIDHIIPVARFDLSKVEHQKLCFNYKNLQPLWAKENMSKGKKITRRNIQKYLARVS